MKLFTTLFQQGVLSTLVDLSYLSLCYSFNLNRTTPFILNLSLVGWFNTYGHIMAVGDAYVFLGFVTQVSLQSHRLLFSHASAEVRGENTPERKFASTGYQTHNHQVMSPTRAPLSHPGGQTYLSIRLQNFAIVYIESKTWIGTLAALMQLK